MKHYHKFSLLLLFLTLVLNCKNDVSKQANSITTGQESNLKYATGFSITNYNNYKVLEINSPWPKSEKNYSYLLLTKEQAMVSAFNKEEYDGIVTIPIEEIVVTSTTHIPALELLSVEQTLVGFPGTDYVSSEKTIKRIANNQVRELGKNGDINTEVLLELKPNAVIGYGVSSSNKTLETINKLGVPVIYNGDWVETSALAKAEWIKFFGVLYNKEKEADSIFNEIEANYLEAKNLAAQATKQPTVLSGALHKDVWYLPSGTSPEAQFLKDANVNYLWSDTDQKGSLALSFESVFEKGYNAKIWLSPSYYRSLNDLEKASQHYVKFSAFKNKQVYSFANTTGANGGVLYYELGTARPDLVLKDIIKICHPNLLPNYQTYFFKPLK
ncbi:ABC transporter substrate-binding protein [Flavobacteriaceae bacterium S0825]|uniref:ABC transporter substrate-binding protein n=1 Tax=Gaetbulibacter sp. S0825 TaxID=2720084 RepID=UPI001430BBDF|nr:ABC transporter substrate-binding protein [Gaetbulibacter sp. S0825]MCK0109330.1 ABC transporter substrate-binding protein [Flavobacteriaceae bacterium S0825]NIX64964.1 ABC transporter substrate-binding protein [Gaetbulibacter sp. S0825]